jgi:hypothetical protein
MGDFWMSDNYDIGMNDFSCPTPPPSSTVEPGTQQSAMRR